MTKKYVRYIFNHIIFMTIIWLCVFVGVASATVVEHTFGTACNDDKCNNLDYVPSGVGCIIYVTIEYTPFYDSCQQTSAYIYDDWFCQDWGGSVIYGISSSFGNRPLPHTTYFSTKLTGSTARYGSFRRYSSCYSGGCDKFTFHIKTYYGEDFYTISGDACGNGIISLTDMADNVLDTHNTTTTATYSFDIMNNTQYKLVFSDRTYEFTCTDDVVEDNDMCDYQIIHYVDDCANLLKNPYIHIIKNNDLTNWLIAGGTSHTDVFMIGVDVQLNDKLDVFIDTDQGTQHRTIYAEVGEDWLYHNTKSWNLDVTVYDINTSAFVTGAKVTVDQDCRINGYAPCTYGTTNTYGFVKTFDLSNQPYRVKVEKENYNTFGYMTINAGFDAQHTNVPLSIYIQDSTKGDGNGTIGDPPNEGEGGGGDTVLPQTECSILWTDDTGNSITEINDTQNARLYFMASNCSTVLTLESRDINAHTWDVEDSIPLTPLQTGYVQYGAANWTYPETKRYQGRLYSYDCGCDVTDDLKVWDPADPNTTLINNLSTYVFFSHTIGSSYINPSSPINIRSYAASNNTSLLNINLSLFNETVKVDEISYTFFDYYVNSQFTTINWKPNYQYTAGYRYSVYMYSNDILVDFDTVYANATGDNPFDTGHALTVKVYDHNSLPLQYSTVYVESWGSIDTGATNEVIFTGLGDDTYEYRAIKSGYLDRGFSTVTLTVDTTVSYILDIIDTEHAIRDIRMADCDIKNMLYPVIFFILIMLLIGVLIDAVN